MVGFDEEGWTTAARTPREWDASVETGLETFMKEVMEAGVRRPSKTTALRHARGAAKGMITRHYPRTRVLLVWPALAEHPSHFGQRGAPPAAHASGTGWERLCDYKDLFFLF